MRQVGRILVSLVVMAATVACGAGVGATASPSAHTSTQTPGATPIPTPEATPTPDPAAAILEICADAPQPTGEPVVLELRTASSKFDVTHLEGPRHCEPFTITLTNTDRVWEHNVSIELMDGDGALIFAGASVAAPSTASYDIPALPAGEYRFVCSPHRGTMRGTIVVTP